MKFDNIGNYIKQISNRNKDLAIDRVLGINIDKVFMPSVANTSGTDLSNYKVIQKGQFATNLMHVGRDERLPISVYTYDKPAIVSPAYFTFEITKPDALLPEYLMLIFMQPEFDRYAGFICDSSVRGNLDWNRFCEINIPIPTWEKQHEYVLIYSNLLKIVDSHESTFNDLRFVTDTLSEKLAERHKVEELGKHIEKIDLRNKSGLVTESKSVSVTKEFKSTGKKVNKKELHNYKIVKPGQFAYVPTTANEKRLCIALSSFDHDIVVSQVDIVFKLSSPHLLPEYVYICLSRKEMDRYARYHSWGSVRETFDWDEMQRIKIPIPPMYIQQSIVALHHALETRKMLTERLKNTMKNISPIMIKDANDKVAGAIA